MLTFLFHIVPNKIFNFNDDDIITFDDGHYSILKNIHILPKENKKILFITPNFISLKKRNKEPNCNNYYMNDFFISGSREQFLTLPEIEYLIQHYNFEFGMHSFYHDVIYTCEKNNYTSKLWRGYKVPIKLRNNFNSFFFGHSKLAYPGFDFRNNKIEKRTECEYLEFIQEDTQLCISWFKKYLGFTEKYAFPFFEESDGLKSELKRNNILDLYGPRICLDKK